MSAARQARDVLLAVLAPHDATAADRAEEEARRLGLEREEREAVRHATELHALGEQVLSAAPSLRAVARLVAESRELGPGSSVAARIVAEAVAARHADRPEPTEQLLAALLRPSAPRPPVLARRRRLRPRAARGSRCPHQHHRRFFGGLRALGSGAAWPSGPTPLC